MRTLLLADDSITVQRVIALTFAAEAIQVVAVSGGQQALEQMASQRPDIILAATTLSQVSGYELAQFVRSKAELQEVPVLLLSGAFETVDEAKLKTSGANGVIEKPVEPIAVIARVKELLGLKSEAKPAPMGRLVTSAEGPSPKKPPVATPPPSVTSTKGTPATWEQLREQTGLHADTASVESPSARTDTHQSSLDVAFDSLDQQLSGRVPTGASPTPGPLADGAGADNPRPVFEVDAEWFKGEASRDQANARAGRREILEDLSAPELQVPAVTPGSEPAPIFEVDEEWFADGNKARAEKLEEQQQLAAEMGIYDVDLPPIDAPLEPAPVEPHSQPATAASIEPAAPIAAATPVDTITPAPTHALADSRGIADDFAVLLAYEQGEPVELPAAPAPVAAPAPLITDEMLDQIAARVADRLTAGLLGEQLKSVMTDTVRDTVRSVVSETSERLVRDEIDRIKSRTQT